MYLFFASFFLRVCSFGFFVCLIFYVIVSFLLCLESSNGDEMIFLSVYTKITHI